MGATFVGCLEELYKLCLLRVTLVSEYGILKVSQELAIMQRNETHLLGVSDSHNNDD